VRALMLRGVVGHECNGLKDPRCHPCAKALRQDPVDVVIVTERMCSRGGVHAHVSPSGIAWKAAQAL
jgi:hypothetical protein